MIDIEKARAEMAKRGLDVLVAGSLTNTFYCTGHYSHVWYIIRDEIRLAVIPRDSHPFVVCPDIEVGSYTKNGLFDAYEFPMDVYYKYPPGADRYLKARENIKEFEAVWKSMDVRKMLTATPGLLLAKVLRDRGLSGARIGVDKEYVEAELFEDLGRALPQAELKDGTDLFLRLRAIKSAQELEYIVQATRITERAIETSFPLVKEGGSMAEIKQNVIDQMSVENSEPFEMVIMASPLPLGEILPTSLGALRSGMIFRWDVGAKYNHYCADVGRQVAIGEAPREAREFYNVVLQTTDAMVEKLRPGTKAKDLYRAAHDVMEKVDPDYNRRLFNGHGLGIELHELPYIGPLSDDVLEPGMVITLEVPHYTAGGYGFNYEDMYLITEDGHQLLSDRLSRELLTM
ncbi:MAG: aminopeptidase P family protein [Chloroflexi bacterium]|nr:aminopeptidase P family protein [Chloroflexota bacterium]